MSDQSNNNLPVSREELQKLIISYLDDAPYVLLYSASILLEPKNKELTKGE